MSLDLVVRAQPVPAAIEVAAARTELYRDLIRGRRIGVVANQTSRIGNRHLVDSLVGLQADVRRIFCPEHGLRGKAEAGEFVDHSVDSITGIPVTSLYGSHKKPSPADLDSLDLMLFDIQDVGVRFYTYISTLHLVMEACAADSLPLLVLDRPNPNGFYVDGPLLDTCCTSFVGMHPIPIVYGLTIGELATMINGEGWLGDSLHCDLTVIPLGNYTHDSLYQLPVAPSPNLPDMNAVYLYPSVCLFEGTTMSLGRGTPEPFQVVGHPSYPDTSYSFTPRSLPGISKNPPFRDQRCYGFRLGSGAVHDILDHRSLRIEYLVSAWQAMKDRDVFFTNFFPKLAGNNLLREQISQGMSADQIRHTWKKDLREYRKIRRKYLLYPDYSRNWLELLFGNQTPSQGTPETVTI